MSVGQSGGSLGNWLLRFAQLQVGLFCFALAISVMLEAKIGLDPWSTFHQGLSGQVGLSFGRITQMVGLVLLVASWVALGMRPGVGTVFNMGVIGPWIDLLRTLDWLPRFAGGVQGVAQFVSGLALIGFASGMYIGARLGAGPRDAFVLGLSRRFGWSIRVTRIVLELGVLTAGYLLGGKVGLGTVLFALLMGPLMQLSLRLFRFEHRAPAGSERPSPAPGATVEGEQGSDRAPGLSDRGHSR